MIYKQFFEIFGGISFGGISAFVLIKYFSQKIFENYMLKKIETHKSELEKLNISHQIKFSSLHVQRAEIIKNLYDYLYDYKLAILDFFDDKLDDQKPKEHLQYKLDQWTKAVIDFGNTFHRNKYFFSIQDSELINAIHNEMGKINRGTKGFLSSYNIVDEQINAINNKTPKFLILKSESDRLLNKILDLEKELESQFRNLLGVEINH